MPVVHSAKRFMAAAVLAAFAIGCGGDSTAPDAPFEPAGTSSDMAAVAASFEGPAIESFGYASGDIAQVTGGAAALALRAAPSAAIARGGKAGAVRYAASLARAYGSGSPRPSLATTAGIPAELLGTTFVFDTETDQYVSSELTGAPAGGVRFLLYAVNPVSGDPIEPLVEIGYADVTTTETATSASVNIVVVSEGVTYLDYTAQVSGSSSAGSIGVSGYATNGDDRVNFDLDNTITNTGSGLRFVLDYTLTVPTRGGFRIDLEATIDGFSSESPTITLDLTARGPHGTVSISGTETTAGGNFEVEVNGDLFATIDIPQSGPATVTSAGGEPLTEAERAALGDVFEAFAGALEFFLEVLGPLPV